MTIAKRPNYGRYESSCEKLMHRNLDELKKRHSEKVDRGENRNYGFGGAAAAFRWSE